MLADEGGIGVLMLCRLAICMRQQVVAPTHVDQDIAHYAFRAASAQPPGLIQDEQHLALCREASYHTALLSVRAGT